jgi:hypothetical protein
MVFINLEKTDMVLIYGEAREHSELPRQIYNFGHLEMNKRDLGHQREDRILVAEEQILREIENQLRTRRLTNHLGVSQFASSKHRQNRGILNRVRLSLTF